MITLHGFGPKFSLPDASPFLLKVDAFLRLSDMPFETAAGLDNFRKAPKGKLPYLSENGQIISDSTLIIQHLQQSHGFDLDQHLSDNQRAMAFLVRSTIEEKLYWCTLYYRWIDETGVSKPGASSFGDCRRLRKR